MRVIVADISHRCVYCIERIAPGTKHNQYVGLWEGDFQNWRMHLECLDAHSEQTDEGEICDEAHLRGETCREKEIRDRIEEDRLLALPEIDAEWWDGAYKLWPSKWDF